MLSFFPAFNIWKAVSISLLAAKKSKNHAALVTRIIYTYFYEVREEVGDIFTEAVWLRSRNLFSDWQLL